MARLLEHCVQVGAAGNLYAIRPNGTLRDDLFLDQAIGAAYTPLSIANDGKILTQNNGHLFVFGDEEDDLVRSVLRRGAARLALGAAYTPLSIARDGKVLAQAISSCSASNSRRLS
ncbi:MAG TPA: hypothetical protein VLX28_00460 [Thermoanaerobaculia bacterium]|nr:hypothetical protein [Thermoanaerobaculia bacterium]